MRPIFLLSLLLNRCVAFGQEKPLVSAGSHKSFGMQVTADRIRMINQLYNIQTQTQIVDLVDSFGEACGTRVLLDIPV